MEIRERIKKGLFYFDGATGSQLQKKGIKPGELPETWNITHREDIIELAKSYFEAGSNAVSANTFGANSLKYDGKDGRFGLEEIVKAGMECALEARRRASGEMVQKDLYVGVDIGPTGKLLKPLGDLKFERAVELFKETISYAVKYGAEFVLIETMNDIYESKAAVIAAHEVSNLPVFVSNVFDETCRTMTSSTPEITATVLNGLGVDAVGTNCSLGPDRMLPVISALYENSDTPVFFMPNAGLPVTRNGKTEYDIDAEGFGEYAVEAVKRGARMLGGCCGTTPEHIAQMVMKTRDMKPLEIKAQSIGKVCSGSECVRFGDAPVLIGERINPTGKKLLKAALREDNMGFILNEAITQEDAGAQVLDINVGLPEINECEMLCKVIKEVQAVTTLPLQIDTGDATAMEAALRLYNGKAMINSVNGKKEIMDNVFPLVKKYGGYVVCLTLDENGIPDTAEGRLKIADKIVKCAAEYGIEKHDLIFDPLAMAVSSDGNAARVTLDTIRLIRDELGCLTSLGVSNVSFGLPERPMITSVFFTMALEDGLNAAIMNPFSVDMMKAYKCFMALNGQDKNCLSYIEFVTELEKTENMATHSETPKVSEVKNNTAVDDTNVTSQLHKAIVRGFGEKAAEITRELLKDTEPMTVINEHIIPALNDVGTGYEEKRLYLPQLLMSAEAAKASFAVLQDAFDGNTEKGPKVVIATVKGDIHDIGKNIVGSLLKNYGFDVIDLGKDVDSETICETVKKHDVKLVGLSALMTTTVPAMAETIKALHEMNANVKVVVGGAVLNEEYARMINADKYAANAMETVRYAESVLK